MPPEETPPTTEATTDDTPKNDEPKHDDPAPDPTPEPTPDPPKEREGDSLLQTLARKVESLESIVDQLKPPQDSAPVKKRPWTDWGSKR